MLTTESCCCGWPASGTMLGRSPMTGGGTSRQRPRSSTTSLNGRVLSTPAWPGRARSGGLVARALWLRRKDRPLPGWIILLGTPNCGTDLAARMLAGVDATFDAWHVLPRALSRRGTALAFPQARVSALWPRSDCWERSGPSPASTRCSQKPTRPRGTTTAAARGARHSGRLKLMVRATSRPRNANSTAGRDLRRRLAEAVDPCRMVNVLGRGFPTWQLTDPRRPDRLASYTRAEGDGAVLLSLGRLPGVDPFVVEAHHADLVVTPEVVEAIDAILDGISPRHGGQAEIRHRPRTPRRPATSASVHSGCSIGSSTGPRTASEADRRQMTDGSGRMYTTARPVRRRTVGPSRGPAGVGPPSGLYGIQNPPSLWEPLRD